MFEPQLHPLRLKADPARVVIRPFHIAWQGSTDDPGRAQRLVDSVLALDEQDTKRQLRRV
ncbi:MAG: glycosidase, partial [Pseudomonadota bacterium]|nr:glycosidase [Pseudomonadota bacterium]